jgi:hypothetical protein
MLLGTPNLSDVISAKIRARVKQARSFTRLSELRPVLYPGETDRNTVLEIQTRKIFLTRAPGCKMNVYSTYKMHLYQMI